MHCMFPQHPFLLTSLLIRQAVSTLCEDPRSHAIHALQSDIEAITILKEPVFDTVPPVTDIKFDAFSVKQVQLTNLF